MKKLSRYLRIPDRGVKHRLRLIGGLNIGREVVTSEFLFLQISICDNEDQLFKTTKQNIAKR